MNFIKKLGLGLLGLVGLTSVSNAAVTFDSATQEFGGTFDLAPYYSAIGIIVTVIAVVAAIGLALRQFKKAA